jgi:hypothetical protein
MFFDGKEIKRAKPEDLPDWLILNRLSGERLVVEAL